MGSAAWVVVRATGTERSGVTSRCATVSGLPSGRTGTGVAGDRCTAGPVVPVGSGEGVPVRSGLRRATVSWSLPAYSPGSPVCRATPCTTPAGAPGRTA
ncbi:hypothetical protein [Saccharothrix carnea]|uniref:hypothetical protein n=1 Tax=Saccharothrix carnea TaxID=1280637 RepID=UPI0011B22D9E|nr:hypothetical protein [Saccharothrix carnea]